MTNYQPKMRGPKIEIPKLVGFCLFRVSAFSCSIDRAVNTQVEKFKT